MKPAHLAQFTVTPALQAFFAARGMWADGEPRGPLASMLGARTPRGSSSGAQFFLSPQQLVELANDVREIGPSGLTGVQVAQTLRRLREAAGRSGDAVDVPKAAKRSLHDSVGSAPFEPLVCPLGGKARQAFERHVMESLHAVVAYSQESVYASAVGLSTEQEGGAA